MTITGNPEEIAKFMVATQRSSQQAVEAEELAFYREHYMKERKAMLDKIQTGTTQSGSPSNHSGLPPTDK